MIHTPAAASLIGVGVVITTVVAIGATQLGAFAAIDKPKDKASNPKSITVGSVVVGNLSPGVEVVKQMALGNPNNQDVELRTITTSVTGPSPAGACTSPSDIQVLVAGYNASTGAGPVVTIARNSTVNVPVTVRMNNRPVNQDGCKAKTFTFTFTATATSK